MTDDTKLLPCPFCGAAAKSTDEMFGSVIHCDHLHTCPLDGHEQLAAAIREWNTRAAPAEDVREVGDEPVAWVCEANADSERRGKWLQYSKEIHDPWHQSEVNTTPLYRHPQRPVVMPERRTFKDYETRGRRHTRAEEWNACLNEFARLNK